MIIKTIVIYLLVVLGFGLTAATAMLIMEAHDEIERRQRDTDTCECFEQRGVE